MSQYIVALYDRRENAEQVVNELLHNNFQQKDIQLSEAISQETSKTGDYLVTILAPDERADVARDVMNLHHPLKMETKSGELDLSNQGENTEPFPREALDRERFHYAQRLGKSDEESSFVEQVEQGVDTSNPPDASHLPIEESIDPSQKPITESQTFGFEQYVPFFRDHFLETYAGTGATFDHYEPAYAFGYMTAMDPRYHGMPWDIFEPDAKREWDRIYPNNPWDKYNEAIYRGWIQAQNRKG